MKKLFLIPVLFLLMITPALAIVTIADFNKIQTYTNTSAISNDTTEPIIYVEGIDRVFADGKIYYFSNMTYISTQSNFTGYGGYADNTYFYAISATGSRINISQFYISNSTKKATQQLRVVGDAYRPTFELNKNILITDSKVFVLFGSLYVINTNNISSYCEIDLTGDTYSEFLGVDNDYAYILKPSNYAGQNDFYAVDIDSCGVFYTGNASMLFGLTETNIHGLTYDTSEYVFYASGYNNNSFVSFDSTFFTTDVYDLKTKLNYTNFSFLTKYAHSCDYDQTNKLYACVGLKNSNAGNITVLVAEVEDGEFLNVTEFGSQYFNNPGYDVYTGSNLLQPLLFFKDEKLYVQLFDTVTGVYELFEASPVVVNPYSGLTCNDAYTLCYDTDNTCYPNDGFFYTGSNTSNWLCADTLLDPQNVIYCNEVPTQCTGGCVNRELTNSYGVDYYSAMCYNDTSCMNECGALGTRYSDTLTTYEECRSDGDSDNCLEWVQYSCNASQLSINGGCQDSNTSIDDISILGFGITPYVGVNILTCSGTDLECYNNNIWNVTLIPSPMKLDVQTRTDLGGTGAYPEAYRIPYANTNYFIGIECKYASSKNVFNPVVNKTISGYNVKEITVNESVPLLGGDRSYETLLFVINNTNSFNVYVLDAVDVILGQYYVFTNISSGEVSVYDYDGGDLLYTFTYDSGLTVRKMEMLLYQDLEQEIQNSLIKMYRYIDNNNQPLIASKGVSMIPLTDSLSTAPYSLVIEPLTGQTYLNKAVIESVNSEIYALTNVSKFTSTYTYTGCVYYDSGCYTQRTYLSEKLRGQFFSYEDIEICLNNINPALSPSSTSIEGLVGERGKLILGLLIPMIAFLIFIGVSVSMSDDSQKRIAIYFGAFMFVAGILLFTILGWLPVWLLIVALIIASSLIALFMIRKTE